MNGASRIGGRSGQYRPATRGGGDGRSASLARFRRGRKVGDVISGIFLRRETETLGWALLEGEELLAHLPDEGLRPAAGERVFFRVESLEPEVVLRLLTGDEPAARLAFLLPNLPLGQEAVLYTAARDRLDALLAADGPWTEAADTALRREVFIGRIAQNGAMLAAFVETRARARALCRAGAGAGLLFFQHMPWLSRAVSGLEVSLWSTGETPVFATAVLPSGDRLFVRGAMEDSVLRYRLGVAPSGSAAGVAAERFSPAAQRPGEHGSAESQGFFVASGNGADLVGRILARIAEAGGANVGRFSRKL